MKLSMRNPVHQQFAEWLSAIESSATGAWKDGLSLSTAVYGSNFRVLLFSDTLVFDEQGVLSADGMSAKSCVMLLELSGAWTSPGRWGLRWKVAQVKYYKTCDVEEDDSPAVDAAPAECMFVDD